MYDLQLLLDVVGSLLRSLQNTVLALANTLGSGITCLLRLLGALGGSELGSGTGS